MIATNRLWFDFTHRPDGAKPRLKQPVDRIFPYRKLHSEVFARHCYSVDLDFIEFRDRGSGPVPVCCIEATWAENIYGRPPAKYLRAITNRMKRDSQFSMIRQMIAPHGIPGYLVVMDHTFETFSRIRFYHPDRPTILSRWHHMPIRRFKHWIENL